MFFFISRTSIKPEMAINCDSWCRTALGNSAKHTFKWTIENFLERPENFNESTQSSVFAVKGSNNTISKWYLALYPKGRHILGSEDEAAEAPYNDDEKVYVSLHNYKSRESDLFNGNDDVKATANLSIVDSSGKEQFTTTDSFETCENLSMSLGGDLLVELKTLRNNSNTLLPNGILTILCKLEVFGQDKLFSGSKESFNKTQIKDECQKQVISDLDNLFSEKNFSDLEITCDEEVFYCHRNILSARSTFFRTMFQSNMIENHTKKVDIKDVRKEVFSEVLKFIYTGKVSDDSLKNKARDILAVADKYQIDLLKKLCEAQLISTLNATNCFDLIVVGDLHKAENLKTTALDFVSKNSAFLIKSDVYKDFLNEHPDFVLEVTQAMVLTKEVRFGILIT